MTKHGVSDGYSPLGKSGRGQVQAQKEEGKTRLMA